MNATFGCVHWFHCTFDIAKNDMHYVATFVSVARKMYIMTNSYAAHFHILECLQIVLTMTSSVQVSAESSSPEPVWSGG